MEEIKEGFLRNWNDIDGHFVEIRVSLNETQGSSFCLQCYGEASDPIAHWAI
jgi:hypothetical protein